MARRLSLGAGYRILIIDDSDIALDFQRMLLERFGYEVRMCGALSELTEQTEAWRPDAVVTDVDLPDAADVNVVTALMEHPGTGGAPIVLCSGQPLADLEILRARQAVAGCVSKSENIAELPKLLRQLLADATPHEGSSTTRQ